MQSKTAKRLLAGPYIIWMIGFTVIPLLLIVFYGLTDKSDTINVINVMNPQKRGA